MATKVLFVCHANLVRSPLAAGVFRHLVQQRGLADSIVVDSAGVSAFPGVSPYAGSVAVAAAHGITLTSRSRQMTRADLYDHDHVIVADRQVLAQIHRLTGALASGGARMRLLASLADPHARGDDLDLHDPRRDGPEVYLQVYRQIERACVALLAELAPR